MVWSVTVTGLWGWEQTGLQEFRTVLTRTIRAEQAGIPSIVNRISTPRVLNFTLRVIVSFNYFLGLFDSPDYFIGFSKFP